MVFKKVFLFFCFIILLQSSLQEEYYLTYFQPGKFYAGNTNKIVEYECKFGGEPIAIWGARINSVVDSSQDIELLYLNQEMGLYATKIFIEDHIKTPQQEKDGQHIRIRNPPNGKWYFSVSSEKPFYVDVVISPPKMCPYSKQTVFNYEIVSDSSVFSSVYPHPNHQFISKTGIFVYEETKNLIFEESSWDQLTKWSNYHGQYEQDIYIKTIPEFFETDYYDIYEGYGYWICGSAESPTEKEKKYFTALKGKKTFYKKVNGETVFPNQEETLLKNLK